MAEYAAPIIQIRHTKKGFGRVFLEAIPCYLVFLSQPMINEGNVFGSVNSCREVQSTMHSRTVRTCDTELEES